VPPQVLAAMGEPVVHHRSPDFRPIYERCLARLRDVCRTQQEVLLFTSSGTGAFESAVQNLVSPGDRHLVVSAGSFGERWATMTGAYGADVDHLRYAWGETWTREGLSRHTRSLLTVGLMVALNRSDEFRLHVRAAFSNGVTREEIREVLLHCAVYAGVPAANSAFHMAEEVFAQMEAQKAP